MSVKPLSNAVDVSINPDALDNASVFSAVNTSNAAVAITLAGTDPIIFYIGPNERITIEKEYAATVACTPAQSAGTVWASKVAYTN